MDETGKMIWKHAMHMAELIEDMKRSARSGNMEYALHLAKRVEAASVWIQNIATDAIKKENV